MLYIKRLSIINTDLSIRIEFLVSILFIYIVIFVYLKVCSEKWCTVKKTVFCILFFIVRIAITLVLLKVNDPFVRAEVYPKIVAY